MADDKKYCQISNESIITWAEASGIPDLPLDVLKTLASDATYRIRQTLNVSKQLIHHSKRKKLTCDDFNRTMKWMDVHSVNGYCGMDTLEWVGVPDLGIHIPHDPPVNLSSTALSGDIFHQTGSPFIKAEWVHVSNHTLSSEPNTEEKGMVPLPISNELLQYYHTLFSVITSRSSTLFKMICEDVGSSAHLGPLVGPIIGGVLKGTQKARQKATILRRLLLVIRALVFNPHIHLGPQHYMRDIVNVLIFCVVTERKAPQDTQSIRTLAASILLQLSRLEDGSAWDLSVNGLGGVVGSGTRPWPQHAGALTGLLTLGPAALHSALHSNARQYSDRLSRTLNSPQSGSVVSTKDMLDAHTTAGLLLCSFVKIVVYFMSQLPSKQHIFISKNVNTIRTRQFKWDYIPNERSQRMSIIDIVKTISQYYYLAEDMFGATFVLQLPPMLLQCEIPISRKLLPASDDMLLKACSSPAANKHYRTRLRSPCRPSQIFDSYSIIEPLLTRRIFMSIRGCSARRFEYLRRRSSTVHQIRSHDAQSLFTAYGNAHLNAPMPHRTFTLPLKAFIPAAYSLHTLIL